MPVATKETPYVELATTLVDHYERNLDEDVDGTLTESVRGFLGDYVRDLVELECACLGAERFEYARRTAEREAEDFAWELSQLLRWLYALCVMPDTQVRAVSEALSLFFEALSTIIYVPHEDGSEDMA